MRPFQWGFYSVCCCCLVAKLCPTLLQPHGLKPTRLFCPWYSPGKNSGVGCHALLQGIFNTGIKPRSLVSPARAGEFLTISTTWEAHSKGVNICKPGRGTSEEINPTSTLILDSWIYNLQNCAGGGGGGIVFL